MPSGHSVSEIDEPWKALFEMAVIRVNILISMNGPISLLRMNSCDLLKN
jgi:hypothetical protein